MPAITVANHLPIKISTGKGASKDHTHAEWRGKARKAIIDACLAANVPGITERWQATVLFGEPYDENLPPEESNGKMAIIFVEGLYDTKERTPEVRERLARAIGNALLPFLPKGWEVEVLPKRYDPKKEGAVVVRLEGK